MVKRGSRSRTKGQTETAVLSERPVEIWQEVRFWDRT